MSARSHFSFSRDLEFATEGELAKRMGCPRSLWLRAALKELIDNALDAAEEAGAAPAIEITVDGNGFVVGDNGPGIPPEVVARICDRSTRTSSREAYSEPVRGAQGNALQVLMCLALGFGRDESAMRIGSRGIVHEIRVRVNRLAGRIEVERVESEGGPEVGTEVALAWPASVQWQEVMTLVGEFACLNPHATFTYPACGQIIAARDPGLKKWMPGRPVPVQWYVHDRFADRVLAELRHDPEITVAQFIGKFAGLTDRSKRARIAEACGLSHQPLAALLDATGTALQPYRAATLLCAMRAEAIPPKPAVLGKLGKDQASWALVGNHDYGDLRGLAYLAVTGAEEDVPYRWEVAFGQVPDLEERRLVVGQNFSPAISPAAMLDGFLKPSWRGLPYYLGERERIALLVHRISPSRATLDYGKQRADIGYGQARDLREVIEKVTAKWIKQRERQIRTGRKPDLKERKPERVTIKDTVWQLLPAAYAQASSNGLYPARARQIYYAVRPKVLELTGQDTLSDAYFSAKLLPQFIQENQHLCAGWRVHFDPRGTLHEPHTGRSVELGTGAVTSYIAGWTNGAVRPEAPPAIGPWNAGTVGPRHRFGAVIIAEKEGIADLLLATDVGLRWDAAIVGGKGQATEAALRLADALGLPVFTLHDFDRTGLTIAANLRDGTWRHRYENEFPVHDVGLRMRQVDGLEREPIDARNLKSVGDERLRECGSTEGELEFLREERVELNALTTARLVELVENALAEHGVQKVLPDQAVLANAWRAAQIRREYARLAQKAHSGAVKLWAKAAAPADLEDQLRALVEEDSRLAWDDALHQLIEGPQP